MEKVAFAVVGIRNFADYHINTIKELEKEGLMKLTAVVVRDQVNNADQVRKLRQEGVAVFSSYKSLLKEGNTFVDIVALPVSIPSHSEMAIKAMKEGFDVLLEKPPAPTVAEMDEMIKVEKETGNFCSIGFQFIHSTTIRKIKKMILDNKLGKIKNIACKGKWSRVKSYYERNKWAGKSISMGQLVLDGPMHNAFAHYLNNMIYLAGPDLNSSAKLKKVRAELYRGHSYIESDDNSCLEAETMNGVKINFYATHIPENTLQPYMEIEAEKGKVIWNKDEETKVIFNDGETLEFGDQGVDPNQEVFRVAARKKLGKIDQLYSTIENTRNFVVAINAAYDSAQKIKAIPEELIEEFEDEEGEFKTVMTGLDQVIEQAFAERKLYSDLDLDWTVKTDWVNVEDYSSLNPFK